MTRRRWIADRVAGDRAWLTGDNAEHLVRVLRAKPGQQFDIAADGVVRTGVILSIAPDRVEFELGEALPVLTIPKISIFLAIYKFDRLEWAIEKLTEMGVARILPVISRRTEPHLAKASEKRVERWRKLALEAAQQSRRTAAPEVASPASLKETLAAATGNRIVLDESEPEVSLKSALAGCAPPIALAVGPEGGWAGDEIELFKQSGWKAASLGQTILRAETAAIVAAAVALAMLTHD